MALFGNSQRFRQLLESNWNRLYRVAYSWTHEPSLASDLVQETLSRALQNKDKILDPAALEIWLFKVMANYWRDLLRRRKDLSDVQSIELVDTETPETHTERSRLIAQVHHAIASLNQDQRQVISLVSLQGFSYEEVAKVLEIPVGTVMSRVCRARQNIKKFLHEDSHRSTRHGNIWRLK